MGHINFDKRKRNWIGFYLALAICLVAVGGVAVATYLNTGIEKESGGKKPTASVTAATTAKPVANIVTNVPDSRTTKKPVTTAAAKKTTVTAKAAELYILPLTNEVIRPFSNSQPVYFPVMDSWTVHSGVDFKGKANQAVKAAADGKVSSIEKNNLRWGNIVTVDHGYGVVSIYCGVTVSSTLQVGDSVKMGDAIGLLGDIPCESDEGPHLHFEMKKNNTYIDPIDAIGKDKVKYTTATTTARAAAATTTKAK